VSEPQGTSTSVAAGVPETVGDQRRAFALALLLEQAVRRIYPERGPFVMHPGQWAALRYFARANREASTVAGLARYLGVTLAPASRAVAALARKGLLNSEQDARDRRIVRLSLSDAGRGLLLEDPIQRLAGLIAAMAPDERTMLEATTSRMIEELSDSRSKAGPFVAG